MIYSSNFHQVKFSNLNQLVKQARNLIKKNQIQEFECDHTGSTSFQIKKESSKSGIIKISFPSQKF